VEDCLFCLLVAGRGEVSTVYEDERAVVFMDIQPVVAGHRRVRALRIG
jgi:diadenosine tetraphosphate (Ap4A) HIT family hydrolase